MKKTSTLHRGFLSLEAMGVLAIIAVAIVLAVSAVSILFNKSTLNDETSNVQALVTQARGMLKTQGEYPAAAGQKSSGAGRNAPCEEGYFRRTEPEPAQYRPVQLHPVRSKNGIQESPSSGEAE